MAKKSKKLRKPVKSLDVQVTQRQFKEFRGEMLSKFTTLELKIDSRFKEQDSKLSGIRSDIHRLAAIVEEQNQRNKLVLDSYSLMYEAHNRFEAKVDKELG